MHLAITFCSKKYQDYCEHLFTKIHRHCMYVHFVRKWKDWPGFSEHTWKTDGNDSSSYMSGVGPLPFWPNWLSAVWSISCQDSLTIISREWMQVDGWVLQGWILTSSFECQIYYQNYFWNFCIYISFSFSTYYTCTNSASIIFISRFYCGQQIKAGKIIRGKTHRSDHN
jgi:hypothetical protein